MALPAQSGAFFSRLGVKIRARMSHSLTNQWHAVYLCPIFSSTLLALNPNEEFCCCFFWFFSSFFLLSNWYQVLPTNGKLKKFRLELGM